MGRNNVRSVVPSVAAANLLRHVSIDLNNAEEQATDPATASFSKCFRIEVVPEGEVESNRRLQGLGWLLGGGGDQQEPKKKISF